MLSPSFDQGQHPQSAPTCTRSPGATRTRRLHARSAHATTGSAFRRHISAGVFRRSFRGRRERDEALSIEGSGVGLAIVDESVRLMSRQTRVDPVEGLGRLPSHAAVTPHESG
jgi:hypothetical protein